MHFEYECLIGIPVFSARIVWYNNIMPPTEMININGMWQTELLIYEGSYFYRILINEKILINDYGANMYLPDEYSMLWSVINVNGDGQRLYNNEQYNVNVDSCCICNNCNNDVLPKESTKVFHLNNDSIVAGCFAFSEVTGIHTISAIWLNPAGNVVDVTENNLFKEDDNAIIWLCLDLKSKNMRYINGMWTIKLIIDGKYILEDRFTIKGRADYFSLNIIV